MQKRYRPSLEELFCFLLNFKYSMPNWLSAVESSLKLFGRNECYINLILANQNFKLDRRRNVGYL